MAGVAYRVIVSELPSGTVTFVFTDIANSTRLWEEQPSGMGDALTRHDAIVRDAVVAHGGQVVKGTGDGGFAVFGAAAAALEAAVALQRAMAQESWTETGPLRVRIGVHTGVAQCRDGDYFGPVLNRTARLMAVAHGGQIVCSQATADLARDASTGEIELVDLGEHRLRDLSRPERIFQVEAPGLGSDFAPLHSMDAFPGNLPFQVSSFIGRTAELERIAAALGEARVVTLNGVGGVGKTRLALQVAAEALPRFRQGSWLVELAAVRDPEGVVDAFATLFGVTARAGHNLTESLIEFLGTKELLLVVDNCEHLLDPVATLVERIVGACPAVVILATSREGLALPGERIIAVPSLGTPGDHDTLAVVAESDAVELFVERARAADADFALKEDNAGALVRLCRRLDGVPLALELAAARVNVMNPAELADALDRRFEVLSGGRRGAVKRQQTLKATIDWSYDLLSAPHQRLLARLAVFASGCTRAAAEAICAGEPIAERSVFGLLSDLVERSLVVAEREHLETRYRLLETIREYGEERLAEYDESALLGARHAEYYIDFARAASNQMLGPEQVDVGRRFALEYENVVAALNYAVDSDDADLALRWSKDVSGLWIAAGDGLRFDPEPALALSGAAEHPLYAFALASAATWGAIAGDLDATLARCDQAVAASTTLEAADRIAVAALVSNARSVVAYARGDTHEAARCAERAAHEARSAGSTLRVAADLGSAATLYVMAGKTATAYRLASEGLAAARQVGMPSLIVRNLVALAGSLVDDDPEGARALVQESIRLRTSLGVEGYADLTQTALVGARLGDWGQTLSFAAPAIRQLHWYGNRPLLGAVLNLVARAVVSSLPETAAKLQGAARTLATTAIMAQSVPSRTDTGPPRSSSGSAIQADFVTDLRRVTTAMLRDSLGDTRLRELRQEGELLGLDQAVAYALDAINEATRLVSLGSNDAST